jgi:hypothetical protein
MALVYLVSLHRRACQIHKPLPWQLGKISSCLSRKLRVSSFLFNGSCGSGCHRTPGGATHAGQVWSEVPARQRRLPWASRLGVGREFHTLTSLKLYYFEIPAKVLKRDMDIKEKWRFTVSVRHVRSWTPAASKREYWIKEVGKATIRKQVEAQ